MMPHGLLVSWVFLVHKKSIQDIVISQIPLSNQNSFDTVVVLSVEAYRVIQENKWIRIFALRVAHCINCHENNYKVVSISSPK